MKTALAGRRLIPREPALRRRLFPDILSADITKVPYHPILAADIVLADIGMPGRNGYEVAEYIKQSPRLAHIPVVLLTGAFEPVDQAKATAAGCDGVLAKPFEPHLVIERVRDLLARPGRPAPLA